MYESSGIRTNVEWNLEGLCPKYIYECDMMEQKEREVVFDGQRAKFEIRPFEIKTFCWYKYKSAVRKIGFFGKNVEKIQ